MYHCCPVAFQKWAKVDQFVAACHGVNGGHVCACPFTVHHVKQPRYNHHLLNLSDFRALPIAVMIGGGKQGLPTLGWSKVAAKSRARLSRDMLFGAETPLEQHVWRSLPYQGFSGVVEVLAVVVHLLHLC